MTNFFRDNGLISKDIITDSVLRGKLFYLESFTTLGNGASVNFSIEVPDKEVAMFFHISSSSRIEIEKYGDSDFTGIIPMIIRNANENFGNSSRLNVFATTTLVSSGVLLWKKTQGVSASIDQGGDLASENFNILKRNSKHIYRLISRDTNNIVSYKLFWIEN